MIIVRYADDFVVGFEYEFLTFDVSGTLLRARLGGVCALAHIRTRPA